MLQACFGVPTLIIPNTVLQPPLLQPFLEVLQQHLIAAGEQHKRLVESVAPVAAFRCLSPQYMRVYALRQQHQLPYWQCQGLLECRASAVDSMQIRVLIVILCPAAVDRRPGHPLAIR